MKRNAALTGLALVLAMALAAVPAMAGTPDEPDIVDVVGDANFINTNGNVSALEEGPDTRPASIDGADFEKIWFSTEYETVKSFNEDGSVFSVNYFPRALLVNIKTLGNVKPTFGPSLIFRIQGRVVMPDGQLCESWFQAFIRGSQPQPLDINDQANIRRITAAPACPAVNTITSGFGLSFDGSVMTMRYPFDAAPMQGYIQPGTQIDPPQVFLNASSYPHVRTFVGSAVTAPTIDETARFPGFVVGQDVPSSVLCANQPAHPDCQP